MRKIITAMLLVAMPVIALCQVPDHDAEMKKIRAERQEMLIWQETVIRGQIAYQLEEMRNRIFIERLFPDVYMPHYVEPYSTYWTLSLPDLFIPEE